MLISFAGNLGGILIPILVFIWLGYHSETEEFKKFENKVLNDGFENKILDYKDYVLKLIILCHECQVKGYFTSLEEPLYPIEDRETQDRYQKGFPIKLTSALPRYFPKNIKDAEVKYINCYQGRIRKKTKNSVEGDYSDYFFIEYIYTDDITKESIVNQSSFWEGSCGKVFRYWIQLEHKNYFVTKN